MDSSSISGGEDEWDKAKRNYTDNTQWILIYLKTTFFNWLTDDLYCYKKEHGSFPDESGVDQSSEEKQFDVYRELGLQPVWKMTNDSSAYERVGPDGLPAWT